MKTLSTTNSIKRLPLRYGLFVIALGFAFWAMAGTARGQMFVSVNTNPFTNGGSYIYQYDPTGTYTTFLSNLDHPRGLAFDNFGNLYVATFTWVLDSEENILGFGQGSILKVSGGLTSTFATFPGVSASGLATDTDGNVFVSSQEFDGTASTIYKVTPSGAVSTFGSVPGQCFGLAFDSAGNLFAPGANSTLTYGTIYQFTPGGVRSIFVGAEAFSSSPGPVGLAFDASNPPNLFASISDGTSNSGIVEFARDGTKSTFTTGLSENPRGLAFDSFGNLFVAGPGSGAIVGDILKFTPPTPPSTTWSESTFASQGFGTRGNRGPEFLAFAPGAVTPVNTAVTLTFPAGTSAGTTTVTPIPSPSATPSPSEFQLGTPPLAFDITTTATYTAPIIIAFQVPQSFLDQCGCNISTVRVLHGTALEDVTCPVPNPGPTPDTTTNTVYASVSSLSPFVIAKLRYGAQVQQPINADGSSVFNANRGVVPVKFTLTQDGVATCALPTATIALTRTSGGTTGAIDESVYSGSADTGSNFRISSCQYVYNLSASALGVGTYRADIKINGTVVGNAIFQLK